MKKTFAVSTAAAVGMSLEEKALFAKTKQQDNPAKKPPENSCPTAKIGDVKISRLICGGNLINGYAHSRDLIYVSSLVRHYFTEEKVMQTWQKCEQNGINTAVLSNLQDDRQGVETMNKYRKKGGKIQWIAQCGPEVNDLKTNVKRAVDNGAVGAFILGNVSDRWVKEDRVELIGKTVDFIKQNGLIAGVAAHSVNVPIACEIANIDTDFYMKTLHSGNYWSSRKPDQHKDVIDNYDVDNYWSKTPEQTIDFFKDVKKPWIAYKVLAAGAIHPWNGFEFAFENGADFVNVGMYDFQIDEDANITREILAQKNIKNRTRPWMA